MRDDLIENQISKDSQKEAVVLAAEKAIDRWRRRGCADFVELLRDQPKILHHSSLLLELAYEAYCFSRENGTVFDATEITSLMPAIQDSLLRRIEVDNYLRGKLVSRSDSSVVWPNIGESISGFQIVDQIGQGGTARVYLCEEKAVGDRQVVVKVSATDVFEANVMGKLSHVNIMPVLSASHDAERGVSCLCMPFLGRSTLRNVIEYLFRDARPKSGSDVLRAIEVKKQITDKYSASRRLGHIDLNAGYETTALQIGLQVADALCYSHSHGIAHGDLKPSNVVMTPSGSALLVDFNLAGIVGGSNGVVGGTLPYMPPERIIALMSESRHVMVNKSTDIFGFGVMLYELLVGKNPFVDACELSNSDDIMSWILYRQKDHDRIRRSLEIAVANPSLVAFVVRCLAFDISERPRDMCDLRDSLLELIRVGNRSRYSIARRRVTFAMCCFIVSSISWLMMRRAIENRPYDLGLQLFRNKQFRLARGQFEKCLGDEVIAFEAHFAMACAGLHEYRVGGDLQILVAAKQDLQAAAEFSTDPRVEVGFSVLYIALSQYQEAIQALERAVDQGVYLPSIWNNLAYSYFCLSREIGGEYSRLCLEKAGHAIEQSIKLDPRRLEPRFNHAVIELGRFRASGGSFVPMDGLESLRIVAARMPSKAVLFCGACLTAAVAEGGNQEAQTEFIRFVKRCQEQGVRVESLFETYGELLKDLPVETPVNDTISNAVADHLKIDRIIFPEFLLSPCRLDA